VGDARIGFAGDAMLGRGVSERWRGRDPTALWGSTLERLRDLDGLVLNLECCVSDRGRPRPERTYTFRADPAVAVPALSAADVSVATLANNHVLDYGPAALRDTVAHLDAAGVAGVGAGPDRRAALTPAVVDAGGLTVAVVSLTDRWRPYAAGPDSPGTAFAPLWRVDPSTRATVRRALRRARARDPGLLVASLHWGPNWETAPAAAQRRFARWLVDRGVDVVHGHSAHVLQGVEVYRGRPILYDTGDVVDDYVDREDVHNKRSALFELVVSDGAVTGVRAVPVALGRGRVDLAAGETARRVCETLRNRSRALGTGARVRKGDTPRLWVPLDQG